MNLPPFVLVHRPGPAGKGADPTEAAWLADVGREAPSLARSLEALRPPLRSSLLRSALGQAGATPGLVTGVLERATQELQRLERVQTIGLWDVGARVGRLPDVIASLNAAQPAFALFQVQAAAPMGLVSAKEWVAEWFRREHHRRLGRADLEALDRNIIADDFLPRVDRVRRDLGLDYLAAITPSMIAGWDDEDGASWNYFNWWDASGRNLLVSTYDVRTYAQRAERPFEAAVAGIAISALLVIINPRLEYHEESRGCLFDKNDDRDSLVKSLRAARIDPQCLRLLLPRYRSAAEAMVDALRSYAPKE